MDALYHYCSSSAFHSIIANRKIWLSSLSLSNDHMEGRLVSKIFERFFADDKVSPAEREIVSDVLRFVEGSFGGLGFCLSVKPDLLSQWRGYADDGCGFSIGFSKAYLDELVKIRAKSAFHVSLGEVVYDPKEHEVAVRPTYDKIKPLIADAAQKRPGGGLHLLLSEDEREDRWKTYRKKLTELFLSTAPIYRNLFLLKGAAFAEEREWRLLSYTVSDQDEDVIFRASNNRLVPYRELPLIDVGLPEIKKVYIGPRNITPISLVKQFLAGNGFKNVEVEVSSATYR